MPAFRLADFLKALASKLTALEISPGLQDDLARITSDYQLSRDESTMRQLLWLQVLNEATRSGGLWGLQWDITNRSPNSTAIWSQWAKHEREDPPFRDPNQRLLTPTALAECDELSAFYAFLAHALGIRGVGLFWPQWNHVVAVWCTVDRHGKAQRIVVPTSQVFLDPQASLGTRLFDPWKQRKIYEYRRSDCSLKWTMSPAFASDCLQQINIHGGSDQSTANRRRQAQLAAWNSAY